MPTMIEVRQNLHKALWTPLTLERGRTGPYILDGCEALDIVIGKRRVHTVLKIPAKAPVYSTPFTPFSILQLDYHRSSQRNILKPPSRNSRPLQTNLCPDELYNYPAFVLHVSL